MATTRSRVYGPPQIAADTALRLKADERAVVSREHLTPGTDGEEREDKRERRADDGSG